MNVHRTPLISSMKTGFPRNKNETKTLICFKYFHVLKRHGRFCKHYPTVFPLPLTLLARLQVGLSRITSAQQRQRERLPLSEFRAAR